ncbi:FAD-binding oxidoreductase [Lignipirellula cremea]|uniref:FAD-binding oxidoreductase n=1 Tax=Lignipirellula cremea TaxID=2528010 RepID=UPI001E2A9F3A|nr:FAD-linked oxidase C-terminal domain-containing protein [Lignipirellula cremea]
MAAASVGIAPQLVEELRQAVGVDGVLSARSDLMVFECDGFVIEKNSPDVVVFPRNTQQVQQIVAACNKHRTPFLPRGAGTSLAGGCLPVGGGVMIVLTRMKQIVEINLRDRYAVVEPGVVNVWLTQALKGSGFHYAPDPSSQGACTIGGNVATNSGGPHTLKYGVTVNHVLGIEAVLADGRIIQLGGPAEDPVGIDLIGAIVGSEGTLAIVTKVWVRLTRDPQGYRTMLGVFDSVEDATNAISEIIGAGIVPAALEMMDQGIIAAIEAAYHFGFPLDAEAVLLIEVDGLEAGLNQQRDRIIEVCNASGAREVRLADDAAQRQKLWKSRKQAFGAIGRLSPSYCTQDGVVPRTQLPRILRRIKEIGKKYDLQIVNVFHAGDGNIHPILLFDERNAAQVGQVLQASNEILEECLACGGSVTGEHGIGVEKIGFMNKMFRDSDLDAMRRLRQAFNPENRLSPDKMLPTAGACGIEQKHPGRRAAM